jgi:hypothetical protein
MGGTEQNLGAQHSPVSREFTTKLGYVNGILTYLGKVPAGSTETDPVWRIKKLIYDGTLLTDIQFPSGSTEFKFKWSDRTTYTYS